MPKLTATAACSAAPPASSDTSGSGGAARGGTPRARAPPGSAPDTAAVAPRPGREISKSAGSVVARVGSCCDRAAQQPARARARRTSMSAAVRVSVAQTRRRVPSAGKSRGERQPPMMPSRASASSTGAPAGRAFNTNSWKTRARADASATPGSCASAATSSARAREQVRATSLEARAGPAAQGGSSRAGVSSPWLVQMLTWPSRGGCAARAPGASARIRGGPRASRSGRRCRPGILRTCSFLAGHEAEVGPAEESGRPRGWPSPTAMSAPYSPGGSPARATAGSTAANERAARAWPARPRGLSSSARKFGCTMTAAVQSSAARRSEARIEAAVAGSRRGLDA